MAEFASKGVAGTGLGLGIAGTALGLLSGGLPILNSLNPVSKASSFEMESACQHDLTMQAEIAKKDAEIARINAERYADTNGLELYKYVAGELKDIRNTVELNKDNTNAQFAQQAVYNATANGTISTIANQVSNLQTLVGSITRTAIPQSAICDFGCSNNCAAI